MQYAATLADLGLVAMLQDDYQTAVDSTLKATESLRASFSDTHPLFATLYNNLGSSLEALGRNDEALAYLEQALAIARATRAPGHTDIAMCEANVGDALRKKGEHVRARELLESSLATYEQAAGRDALRTAQVAYLLAELDIETGRVEDARRHIAHALEIAEKMPPEAVAERWEAMIVLAKLFTDPADAGRARGLAQQGVEVAAVYVPTRLAEALVGQAEVELHHGDRVAALRALEQALAKPDITPEVRAVATELAAKARAEE